MERQIERLRRLVLWDVIDKSLGRTRPGLGPA